MTRVRPASLRRTRSSSRRHAWVRSTRRIRAEAVGREKSIRSSIRSWAFSRILPTASRYSSRTFCEGYRNRRSAAWSRSRKSCEVSIPCSVFSKLLPESEPAGPPCAERLPDGAVSSGGREKSRASPIAVPPPSNRVPPPVPAEVHLSNEFPLPRYRPGFSFSSGVTPFSRSRIHPFPYPRP